MQELSLTNTTSNLGHTRWQSQEPLTNVEASINFKLSKAYLIQELSGNKVSQ